MLDSCFCQTVSEPTSYLTIRIDWSSKLIDLFTPVVEEDLLHKNFNSVLVPNRTEERERLLGWCDGFVDRDGKLVEEFQTTFNSTFWEIYIYAVLKKYGFEIDWDHSSPDFCVSTDNVDFVIEATTANSAVGKPNEWDRFFSEEELQALKRFRALNTEAIIRLSNSILGKSRKFEKSYRKLGHVAGKPFVLAVAPFEQPHFNFQYDRPIKALLYDYYVDEDAFLDNPDAYSEGPPGINLGHVEKENGAEIPLGIFNDPGMSEISAVIFSCTATWGKLSAMSSDPENKTMISSIWAEPPDGAPAKRRCIAAHHNESIRDGLQVYHNPYATHPLPPDIFRGPRIVQDYLDVESGEWVHEGRTDALLFRQSIKHIEGVAEDK